MTEKNRLKITGRLQDEDDIDFVEKLLSNGLTKSEVVRYSTYMLRLWYQQDISVNESINEEGDHKQKKIRGKLNEIFSRINYEMKFNR